jgi:hypothetical protein
VVQWSPDVASFIANGLSPAKVLNVILQDDINGKTAVVVVPDKQLSLAIGKEGQNARLAAKLTGWRIDIKSATEAAEEALRKAFEKEPVREATTEAQDILAIAEEILKEKEGVTLSDGELRALSQVIKVVDEAEAALELEMERAARLQAEAEAAEAAEEIEEVVADEETMDLLVQAEALLTAKEQALEEAAVEVEGAIVEESPDAEEVPTEEEAPVEAALSEVAPAEVTEAEPDVTEEAEVPGVAEVAADVEEGLKEVETTPEVKVVDSAGGEIDWFEEAEGDEDYDDRRRAKKKRRRKKRQLVFDENLGEVVARRRRKPGRRREEWEDY